MHLLAYLLFLVQAIPLFSKPRILIFAIDGLSSLFLPIPTSPLENENTKSHFSPNNNQANNANSFPSKINNANYENLYPSISFLISQGSYAIARSIIEAISAPGWIATFCSLDSSSTGIMANTWTPTFKPINKKLPCLFETLKNIDEKLDAHFLFGWDWMRGLASDLTKTKSCESHEPITTFICDRILTNEALKIISHNDNWDVIVLTLLGMDEAGQEFNWGSHQYKETLELIDSHIGKK
jgi:hypothetical protein